MTESDGGRTVVPIRHRRAVTAAEIAAARLTLLRAQADALALVATALEACPRLLGLSARARYTCSLTRVIGTALPHRGGTRSNLPPGSRRAVPMTSGPAASRGSQAIR
jgi:hypothetical protein